MPRGAPPVPPSSCAPQLGDGGARGARSAEPCNPRARPASSSRSVSWEARGPERSHRSGGLLGPAQVLCRLTPAGPRRGALLASEERERTCARAREGTPRSLENTPARGALARRDAPNRAEKHGREARRGEHTPRRATSTRTTRAIRRAAEWREPRASRRR